MAEGDPPPRVVWTRDGARWDEEMDPGAESSQRRNTLVTRYYAVLSHYCKKIFCENSNVRGFIWSS